LKGKGGIEMPANYTTLKGADGFGIQNLECFNRYLGCGLLQVAQRTFMSELGPSFCCVGDRHIETFPANP